MSILSHGYKCKPDVTVGSRVCMDDNNWPDIQWLPGQTPQMSHTATIQYSSTHIRSLASWYNNLTLGLTHTLSYKNKQKWIYMVSLF